MRKSHASLKSAATRKSFRNPTPSFAKFNCWDISIGGARMLAKKQWSPQNFAAIIMELLDEQRNLEGFGELVLADRELHEKLRAAPDEMAFISLVVHLAGERGFIFTAATAQAVLNEKRRAWLERWV